MINQFRDSDEGKHFALKVGQCFSLSPSWRMVTDTRDCFTTAKKQRYRLPLEVLIMIWHMLDNKDREMMASCCKQFREATKCHCCSRVTCLVEQFWIASYYKFLERYDSYSNGSNEYDGDYAWEYYHDEIDWEAE